jgi:hypothetical protein
MIETIEERPEMKKLRDEFLSSLPKVRVKVVRFRRRRGVRSILLFPICLIERRSILHLKLK